MSAQTNQRTPRGRLRRAHKWGRGAGHYAARAEGRGDSAGHRRDAPVGVFESRGGGAGRAVSGFICGQRRVWARGVEPRRGGRGDRSRGLTQRALNHTLNQFADWQMVV